IAVSRFIHRDGIREMLPEVRLNQESRSTNQQNKVIPIPKTAGSLTSNKFGQGFSVILRHLFIGFPTSIKGVRVTIHENKIVISYNIAGSASYVNDSCQSFPGILTAGSTAFKADKNAVDVLGVSLTVNNDFMSYVQHLFQF